MYRRILVPIDGSHTSALGLEEAIRLAKNQHAKLRLVHVVDEFALTQNYDGMALINADKLIDSLRDSGRQTIARAIALARRHGVKAESALFESLSGRVSEHILGEAKKWRADLIVMGTHGRRGVNRLVLGSDAEVVLRSTPVPVLLVRSGGRKTPARKKKAS